MYESLVCDYIFVNRNDLKLINCEVSEHLPMILDFEI